MLNYKFKKHNPIFILLILRPTFFILSSNSLNIETILPRKTFNGAFYLSVYFFCCYALLDSYVYHRNIEYINIE